METQKINNTFENIPIKKRTKLKRKYLNQLFINTRGSNNRRKNFFTESIANNLRNMTSEKLFNTELENKSVFFNMKKKYLTKTVEPQYKMKIKKNFNSPQKYNNKIFNSVKEICNTLYESKYKDNSRRMKLREDIIHRINQYVFSDLQKNILTPQIINRKRKKRFDIVIPNQTRREKKLKSIDSNKLNLKQIMKECKDESPKIKTNNLQSSRMITFENYAKNDTKYNHPQVYLLNTNYYNERKLIPIKTYKKFDSFLDLSKSIPERMIDQKEINKQIYTVYKTMKNKSGIAFHIK